MRRKKGETGVGGRLRLKSDEDDAVLSINKFRLSTRVRGLFLRK
jgi:hypothetical protein